MPIPITKGLLLFILLTTGIARSEIYYPVDEEIDTEVDGIKTKTRHITNKRFLNGKKNQPVGPKKKQQNISDIKTPTPVITEKNPTEMSVETEQRLGSASKKIEISENLKPTSPSTKKSIKVGLAFSQFAYLLESRDINSNGVAAVSTQEAHQVTLNWENRFLNLLQFNFDFAFRFLNFTQPTNRVFDHSDMLLRKTSTSLMLGKRLRIGAGILMEERPFLTRVSATVLDLYPINLFSPYLIGEAQIVEGENFGLLASVIAGTILERKSTIFKVESGAQYMGKLAASYDWKNVRLDVGPYYNKWDTTTNISIQEEKEWGGALKLQIKF